MNDKLVSIIFICWNRKDEVRITLNKLQNLSYSNKEIVVVDNNSNDGTLEMIKEEFPNVIVSKEYDNIGIEAYNHALEKTNGEYVFVLDDDSHLEKDSIEKAIDLFEKNQDYGIVAFKVILPETGEIVTKTWKHKELTSFWGCGFAIKRELIDKLDTFYDKDLFLYTNEYDLAIRTWNMGYKVIYGDNIIAYHRVSSMNRVNGRLVEFSVANDIAFNYKYIPFPWIIYTLPNNMLIWFIRSIMEGSLKYWFIGLKRGIINIKKHKHKKQKVKDEVLSLYLNNHRNFENPISKFFRKLLDKTLFKKVENV